MLIISQSITQLVVRSLIYFSLLILLPSFIAITSAREYSNIVLLSTLVMLAPLFDGGQAMAMTRWLAANSRLDQKDSHRQAAIALALRSSVCWSISISAAFIVIWMRYTGQDAGHGLGLSLTLGCVAMAALTTVANTCNRLMLAENFTSGKAAALIAGPALTAIVLCTLRYVQSTDIELIVAAFAVGASLSILLYLKAAGDQITDVCDLLEQCFKRNKFEEDKKYRYGIFLSQAISVLVVAKNPILIRYICGDTALMAFSLFSAVNALIIAPAAAMQSPLLVSYSKQYGCKEGERQGSFRVIARHTLLAVAMGAIIAMAIWFLHIYFNQYINKDTRLLSVSNILLILCSAAIYIASIVIGVFFAAIGSAKLINVTAVLVLAMDSLLILLLTDKFQGMTPIITIAISNIASILILVFVLHGIRSKV